MLNLAQIWPRWVHVVAVHGGHLLEHWAAIRCHRLKFGGDIFNLKWFGGIRIIRIIVVVFVADKYLEIL